MSAEAMGRFLTLVANDPEMAGKYYELGWEEVTDEDQEGDVGAESEDSGSDPAKPSPNFVDTFPGLSTNEKAILKTKNLELILDYIREELPPKPLTDVPPPDPPAPPPSGD